MNIGGDGTYSYIQNLDNETKVHTYKLANTKDFSNGLLLSTISPKNIQIKQNRKDGNARIYFYLKREDGKQIQFALNDFWSIRMIYRPILKMNTKPNVGTIKLDPKTSDPVREKYNKGSKRLEISEVLRSKMDVNTEYELIISDIYVKVADINNTNHSHIDLYCCISTPFEYTRNSTGAGERMICGINLNDFTDYNDGRVYKLKELCKTTIRMKYKDNSGTRFYVYLKYEDGSYVKMIDNDLWSLNATLSSKHPKVLVNEDQKATINCKIL